MKSIMKSGENIKLKDLLNHIEEEDYENLSDSIVKLLKSYHKDKIEKDWEEKYTNTINLTIYNHGLLKKYGMKDYVLSDFVDRNKFLIKNRNTSKILNCRLKDLTFDSDLNICLNFKDDVGDYILDFLDLNRIALYHPKLSKLIVDKYFENKPDRRFFKLLSLYTAVDCLNFLIVIENEKDPDNKEILVDKFDRIFAMYEDFTREKPTWYVESI